MDGNRKKRRFSGLDALRGMGMLGIVLYHLFPTVFCGGFLGVPLFFVLSGYLMFVTSQDSFHRGQFHIGSYYKKRIQKIFPPLFAMMMVICCYLTLFQSSRLAGIRGEVCSIFLGYDNWWQIQQNASYFSRMANASPFTHLWFLAVEIQFYLLWPVLFLVYQKGCEVIGGKKMCFFFLALAMLSAGRMFCLYMPGQDPSRVYYGTDTMIFPLLIGNFLGAVRQNYDMAGIPFRKKGVVALFALSVLITCILYVTVDGQSGFVYRGGMFAISLFFGAVVSLLISYGKDIGEKLESSLVSLVGRQSYLIYLWHYPLVILMHIG